MRQELNLIPKRWRVYRTGARAAALLLSTSVEMPATRAMFYAEEVMFTEFTRVLSEIETPCTVNLDEIVWAQPKAGTGPETEIFMAAGEPLTVKESYSVVRVFLLPKGER